MEIKHEGKEESSKVNCKEVSKGKEKGEEKNLDEFVKLTKYNRMYASYLLRNWGKKIVIWEEKQMFVFILGERRKKLKRKREKFYGIEILPALKKIWGISGYLCGKRLKEYIKETLPILKKYREIKLERRQYKKILMISASTIDRLLSLEKKKLLIKARSGTKPGTLLRNQIPVKTFSEWDRERPGFVGMDLVSHEGGNPSGEFIQTLDISDACTQWTETQGVLNKAHIWVFQAIKDIRKRMPFDWFGIHSDGGGEFINKPVFQYCLKEKLTFTHSRFYKKNDNCFVEQKNYSVVRKTVGYLRYEGEDELKVLNEIYKRLRLITNFFTPSMKLINKIRIGSKIIKKYDKPKTPYQRVLDSPYINEKVKEKFKRQYCNAPQ